MKMRVLLGCALVACLSAGVASAQTIVGQWDFDNSGDLTAATLGSALAATGTGLTAIPGISGADGAVTVGVGSYYTITHGIAANNGGTEVNNYALVFDVRVSSLGAWRCFYSTENSPATNDGEIFIKNSNTAGTIGVGDVGYSANAMVANTWYRVVITFKFTNATTATYNLYVDGVLWKTTTGPLGNDSRFGLHTGVNLFADNDGEDGVIDVSTVAIIDEGISAAQAAALGVAGDPVDISLPLAISTQPVGGNILIGAAHTFTVVAAGGTPPYSYQWKQGVTNVGTDSASYGIASAIVGDSGSYTVTVTDSASPTPAVVTSNAAALSVTDGNWPAIPIGVPVLGLAGLAILGAATALAGARRLKK